MDKLHFILKYPLTTLVAALVTAALSTPITSVQNLMWLQSMQMPVDFGVVVQVILKDLFRLGGTLTVLILAGFSLAFLVCGLIRRWVPVRSEIAYGLAAIVAMIAILILMVETTFGVQLVAGNRTMEGTAAHLIAGLIGGVLFARMISVNRDASFSVRVFALIPLIFLSWAALNWILDPATAASGFGFDFAELSDLGQNTLIRDMTAFFMANCAFLLLGIISLRYQWFAASSMVFFFAMLFNIIAIEIHGTGDNEALSAEIVLFVWIALLGIGTVRLARTHHQPI